MIHQDFEGLNYKFSLLHLFAGICCLIKLSTFAQDDNAEHAK
jgi:hypothetical protein